MDAQSKHALLLCSSCMLSWCPAHADVMESACRLVGIARLEPTKDVLLDRFLRLPSDCKALMSAQFVFNPSMDERVAQA